VQRRTRGIAPNARCIKQHATALTQRAARSVASSIVPASTASTFVLNAARALQINRVAGICPARLSPSPPLRRSDYSGTSPVGCLDADARPDVFVPPAHRVDYSDFFSTYSRIRLQDLRASLSSELQDHFELLEHLADFDHLLDPDDEHALEHIIVFEDSLLQASRTLLLAAGAAETVLLLRRRARGEPLELEPSRRRRGYWLGQPRHPLS